MSIRELTLSEIGEVAGGNKLLLELGKGLASGAAWDATKYAVSEAANAAADYASQAYLSYLNDQFARQFENYERNSNPEKGW